MLLGALCSGLIDALGGRESALEEVAQAAGTDVRASRDVLAALVLEGIVEEVARGRELGSPLTPVPLRTPGLCSGSTAWRTERV